MSSPTRVRERSPFPPHRARYGHARQRRITKPLVLVTTGALALAATGYGVVRFTHGSTPVSTAAAATVPAGSMAGMDHSSMPMPGSAPSSTGSDAGIKLNDVRVPTDKASMTEMDQLLALVPEKAATAVAAKSGDWGSAATWKGGAVPGAGAKVLVPKGVKVTYSGVREAAIGTIRVDGSLVFAPAVRSKLVVDTIIVNHTGDLEIGTPAAPATAGVDIVFKGKGAVTDEYRFGRGLVSMGRSIIVGADVTSFGPLTAGVAAGARSVTLKTAPKGWKAGDTVVLTGAHAKGRQDERRTISSISGATVTLSAPLKYDHRLPVADVTPYLANFTRSVTFSSASTKVAERGHVMFMHTDAVYVHGAAFRDLGRTDKNRFADTKGMPLAGDAHNSPGFGTNPLGRYALHIHRAGVVPGRQPVYLTDNAILGSPGWGLVNHGSNVVAKDNAAANIVGAAYVSEVGNEVGSFQHNIAIGSDGPSANSERRRTDLGPHTETKLRDMWADGVGFGMRSNAVQVVDNVATDQAGDGYGWDGWDGEEYYVPPSFLPGAYKALSYAPRLEQVPVLTFKGNVAIADLRAAHLDLVAAYRTGVYSVIDGLTGINNSGVGVRVRYAPVILRNVRIVAADKPTEPYGITLGPNGQGSRVEGDHALVNVTVKGYQFGIDNADAQRTGDADRPSDVQAYGTTLAGNGSGWSVPNTPYLHLASAAPSPSVLRASTPVLSGKPFANVETAITVTDGFGAQKPLKITVSGQQLSDLVAAGWYGSSGRAYVKLPYPIQSRVTGATQSYSVKISVNLADFTKKGKNLGS